MKPKTKTKKTTKKTTKKITKKTTKHQALTSGSIKKRVLKIFSLVAVFVGVGLFASPLVSAVTTTSYSIWKGNEKPETLAADTSESVELGVKFKAEASGMITGIRFYKGPQNTGAHTGTLWDKYGNSLAKTTFKDESEKGWQTAYFDKPVDISANTTYVASYHAPKGHYTVDEKYFLKNNQGNGKLVALKNGVDGPNGVMATSNTTTFPESTKNGANFWVDVVYSTSRFMPTTKPASPTGITTAVVENTVTLSWKPSFGTNPIKYYVILRDGTDIKHTNEGELSFIDTNVTAGNTYTYSIQAVDSKDQKSEVSNTVKAVLPAVTPAPTPDPTPTPTPTPDPTPTPTPTPDPTPTPTPPATSGSTAWKPLSIGTQWQWQLTGTLNETVLDGIAGPKMYDIDMFNATTAQVNRLKSKDIYVVCYVESGDWAKGRPDSGDFSPSILGKTLDGFPDEKFVNINALDSPAGPTGKTLRQIMHARFDMAKAKGCDGIEPDLDDLHNYKTGFTITQVNQVAFNAAMIKAAHDRGMSIGLKNGASSSTAASSFEKQMLNAGADWALNEECNQFGECGGYASFIAAGKPVFQVEYLDNQRKKYTGATGTCSKNNAANFDGIVKDSSSKLSALPRTACR